VEVDQVKKIIHLGSKLISAIYSIAIRWLMNASKNLKIKITFQMRSMQLVTTEDL